MDIANNKGTPVVASARGTVIFAQKKWLIGNLVVIDHGNGIVTKYGHLDKILVKKEDQVNRGDTIGLMGNTGKSTGPHVHYEVLVDGESQDPSRYFSTEMATASSSNRLERKD
jgi:murein DD-endopeptidase MepM/ murein hydrolase activator NlpD